MRPPAALPARPAHPEGARPSAISSTAVCLLAFAAVVFLGLEGGGYDPLVHNQVGLLAWWVALTGVAAGILPRRRYPVWTWVLLAVLAAFVAWTALSLAWTDSNNATWEDVARLTGYLGAFGLGLFVVGPFEAERVIVAVAAGIVVVAAVALLSRLHPSWFPGAGQTSLFITDSRERLSYPIDYWNGLAGLLAIGLPLGAHIAASGRSVLLRGAAAAALPALVLTIFFTLSRGGIAAAAIAIALYLAIAADRIPKLLAVAIGFCGGAVLVGAATRWDALQHGLSNSSAEHQGTKMLVLVLVVAAAAALAQAALARLLRGETRPSWTRPSRDRARAVLGVATVAIVVFAVAGGAPGRISNGWSEFKAGGTPEQGTGRLNSVAGQSRYQLWRAALDENATKPLTGTGSGTFELWWAQHGRTGESVRDTHSLYLQTLAEVGIVGFALLLAFLVGIFLLGGRAARRAPPDERAWIAAAIAGCAAFWLTAGVDWMWQIPALAVPMLILASLVVGAEGRPSSAVLRPLARVGLAVVALVAIVAIAIPLASSSLLRESEEDARSKNLVGALSAARDAAAVLPSSAVPKLQEALVLEQHGELRLAAAAARRAIDLEPKNWRNWLVLSRLEAELGRPVAATADYREARHLNPESTIFNR